MLLTVRVVSLLILVSAWFDTTVSGTRMGLISRRNQVRKLAASAYRSGRYKEALSEYQYLITTGKAASMGERINLGNAYFRLGQYKAAQQQYGQTGTNATPALVARAATQLGVLASLNKDTVAALSYFKQALLSDPDNTIARQNFELLKVRFTAKNSAKKLVRSVPQPAPAPQQTQRQQVDKTEQQKDRLDRLKNAALSDEQARQVLDALRADDLPYALARRRTVKQSASKPTGQW